MKVSEVMSANVVTCRLDAKLPEIARLMCDNDCGAIPVLDARKQPAGVVTDRDIACRAVALGKDVSAIEAREIMSRPVVTVSLGASLEACCDAMERHQVRRVLVVDRAGACCGIVAQADVAQSGTRREAGELVRAVSKANARREASTSV